MQTWMQIGVIAVITAFLLGHTYGYRSGVENAPLIAAERAASWDALMLWSRTDK